MNARQRINEIYEEIVDIRRTIHANPELSEKEVQTSKLISEFLTSYGIEHQSGIAGYGVVAIIKGKKNPNEGQKFITIGIRADMDALPIEEKAKVCFKSKNKGVMHACGHDIHIAVLLGTAKILKEMEDEIPGNIKLFFEPAEETIGGAKQMIEQGCLKNPNVDAVMGLHIAPEIEAGKVEFRKGKMNAASTEFEIAIEGVACHGAHPENGIDSIMVASNLICALQSVISRNLSPTNPGVITVGQIYGGSKANVVAGQTTILGIIRALDNDTRNVIKNRVNQLAENIACSFGAKAQVMFTDSYPALVNDDDLEKIMETVAEQVLGREKLSFLQNPSLGADDFSYFTEAVKAVYFNIGCLDQNETVYQALHNGLLNPSEECIRTGMLMEVFGVIELFKQMK